MIIHIYIYDYMCLIIYIYIYDHGSILIHMYHYTSSTAQGGGGSFKDRKPRGEVRGLDSKKTM